MLSAKSYFQFGFRRAIRPLFPLNCVLCEKELRKGETFLCLDCLVSIPRIRTDYALTYVGAPNNTIEVKSWFIYDSNDASHRLIHDIKYHDRRKLARKLGREFALHKLETDTTIDVILPVPLHWTKQLRRGYNQTREIALGIKDVTGVEVSKNLYAKRTHATQTHMNREERARNVRNLFALRRPEELDGKHIAILDDVITTGATMTGALETILAISAPASVTFLSLARTQNT